NLRVRFGLPRQPHTAQTRLVFLKAHQRVVALIVDSAREFRSIPVDSIRPVEETLHGLQGNYVKGMATVKDRLVLLIDIAAVLRPEELNVATPNEVPAAS